MDARLEKVDHPLQRWVRTDHDDPGPNGKQGVDHFVELLGDGVAGDDDVRWGREATRHDSVAGCDASDDSQVVTLSTGAGDDVARQGILMGDHHRYGKVTARVAIVVSENLNS